MGAVASAIFSVRNIDKVENGDYGRTFAAVGQTYNAVSGLGQLQNTLAGAGGQIGQKLVGASKAANAMIKTVEETAQKQGALGLSAKGMQYASKSVNPLLCLASGYRVVTDDDWQSAAVEETAAMGSMFLAERGAKILKAPVSNDINLINTLKDGNLKTALLNKAKQMQTVQNPKFKMAAIVVSEILFVCASVLAFGAGKEIGKAITGRGDSEITQPPSPQSNEAENFFANETLNNEAFNAYAQLSAAQPDLNVAN